MRFASKSKVEKIYIDKSYEEVVEFVKDHFKYEACEDYYDSICVATVEDDIQTSLYFIIYDDGAMAYAILDDMESNVAEHVFRINPEHIEHNVSFRKEYLAHVAKLETYCREKSMPIDSDTLLFIREAHIYG